MIRRFVLWNEWRKRNLNSRFYQVLVLFGLTFSPTFEMHYISKEAALEIQEIIEALKP